MVVDYHRERMESAYDLCRRAEKLFIQDKELCPSQCLMMAWANGSRADWILTRTYRALVSRDGLMEIEDNPAKTCPCGQF